MPTVLYACRLSLLKTTLQYYNNQVVKVSKYVLYIKFVNVAKKLLFGNTVGKKTAYGPE